METPQTTEKNHIDNTDITPDGKISIPYTEYKSLVQGFQEERKKMEDRMWLDVNLSKLDEVLRNNFENSPKKFSENIVQYLARLVGAVHGAFFVVNHDKDIVEATAGYACTLGTMERTQFQIGEGLVGQVAKSQEMLCLDEIETEINSSLGKIKANYMVILPLAYNKTISGVVELTTLDKLMPRFLIFLDRASHNIAAALQSLINAQKTKEILMDSFEQSEIYKEQQAQIKSLREENQKLQAELQTKNLQHQATEYEPYYLEDEVDQVYAPISSPKNNVPNIIHTLESQNQIDELLAKIKVLEEKNKALESKDNVENQYQNNDLLEKVKVLEEENAENTKKIANLEDNISKKNNDVSIAKEALKWKNDVLEQQDEEISNLKNALAKIQQHESYLVEEKETIQKYIQELQANINFWQNMVTDISDKLNTLEQEAQNKNQQSQESAEEKDAMQRYLNELQINLNFWQEKALSIPENWQEDLQQAKEQKEELTEKYDELQKVNQWQAEKLQNLINELSQKEQQITQITQHISEKGTETEKENELLKLDLSETIEKNQILSQELVTIEQKYKDLIAQFEVITQKLRKKEDELLVSQYLLQQNQTPNQENNLQELQDLKEELEAQKQKNKELEESYKKIQAKKQENEEISKEILKLQDENQSYQQKISTLEAQLLNINENLNQQQTTLDNPKEIAEIAELLLEITQLKEKHQKDTLVIQSLENQIADIEEKNAYHWQEKQNHFNEKIADLEIIQDDLVRKKEFLEQRANMLNQREKELVELFDKINSIFAVLEISPEGEILSANQKFLQLTRLQATELIGQTYTDFLDKNFAESKEFKVLWESLKVGIAQNVEELAFISTKGEKFFYHTSFIPVMNQDNQVTEIVHLFNHLVPPPYASTPTATITSMAEDRVKALDSSLVVIEVDMEGLISRINQQAVWALGYKEGEILACPFTDLLDIAEKESDEYQEWQQQIQQGISTAKIVKYVGKEGEKLKFRTFFYPLRDEHKQTRQWLVCLQKA